MNAPVLGRDLWSGKLFSGGWVEPQGGTIEVKEPATGIALGEVGHASAADIHQATQRAKAAQVEWAKHPLPARWVAW
jgi:benzaldehyde dehydrogenase (NAD)